MIVCYTSTISGALQEAEDTIFSLWASAMEVVVAKASLVGQAQADFGQTQVTAVVTWAGKVYWHLLADGESTAAASFVDAIEALAYNALWQRGVVD